MIAAIENDMANQVWIGLVSVTPQPGNKLLGGAKGAFVNALAFVENEADYRSIVQQALSDLGLVTYDFEDVEPFSERASKWTVNEELHLLADEVSETGNARFGTFHNYLGVE